MEREILKIYSQLLASLPIFNSKVEIIESFLKSFHSISGCNSVSLYLVDQNSFEILLSGSEGDNSEDEINKIFLELVENEIIASVLNNSDDVVTHNYRDSIVRLYPIKIDNHIIGFFLFVYKNDYLVKPEIELLLKHFCNYFALQLEYVRQIVNKANQISHGFLSAPSDQFMNIFASDQFNLLDWLKEGVLIIDKNTEKIINVNEPATHILKANREKIIGTNKSIYFLYFDKNIFKDEIISEDETILITPDGTPIPVLCSVTMINLDNTDYEIISFLDISERKSMEDLILQSRFHLENLVEERTKKLKDSNEELTRQIKERIKKEKENLVLYLAIQQSPAYVILTDLNGNIEFVNNSFLKQTGYRLEEIVKQNPRILKSGDLNYSHYKQLWENIKSGKPWAGEFRNRKKNGELFWVSSQISPIIDSTGNVIKYMAIQEDITQRKKFEDELIDSKEKIEKAYNFKDALLANMSHEFRTPLISIIGCSDLLIEDLAESEMYDLVKAIQQGGNRLLKTLNNVLLLTDLESGAEKFELVYKNIIPLVKTMVDKYGYVAESKNIKFEINFEENELVLAVNEFFFNKVIENLIDNAIKYTQEGSVVVSVKRTLVGSEHYGQITIQDEGIGIPDAEKQIVFDAFRQAEEGHKRNYEGTGLGLTIAQKAIANMNGFIKIENNYPSGSKFVLYLPLEKPVNSNSQL